MDLKQSLKFLKLHESTISTILGALVIVVGGVFLVNYLSNRSPSPQITQIGDETPTSLNHTVQVGEDLWSISERYYGTGDNWSSIAQINNLQNPDDIKEGQVLVIPSLTPTAGETPIATISPFPPQETIAPLVSEGPTPTSTPTPTVFTDNGQGAVSTEALTYTVVKGDTLWKIAEYHFQSGYNWVDIAQVNDIKDPGLIEEGQTLFIPNVEAKKPTINIAQETSSPSAISGASYIVEKGDSLWSIAIRAYGDGYKWVDIAKENQLKNPGLIFAGYTLTLPR